MELNELPNQFVTHMSESQFLSLLSYEPFHSWATFFPQNEKGEYCLGDSPYQSGALYLFNLKFRTCRRGPGGPIGPDDALSPWYISYVDLYRNLRLSTLGIN